MQGSIVVRLRGDTGQYRVTTHPAQTFREFVSTIAETMSADANTIKLEANGRPLKASLDDLVGHIKGIEYDSFSYLDMELFLMSLELLLRSPYLSRKLKISPKNRYLPKKKSLRKSLNLLESLEPEFLKESLSMESAAMDQMENASIVWLKGKKGTISHSITSSRKMAVLRGQAIR